MRDASPNHRDSTPMSERMQHPEVVVIGYGNTLRSDDGFGQVVAETLRARLGDHPRVRIHARPLLTVDLVAELEFSEFCVLIDAATTRDVDTFWLREIEPELCDPATLGHELSAATLLGLTLQLVGRAPRCHLFSVTPRSMDFGEELSPELAALSEPVVDAIAAMIDRYLIGRGL